MKLTYFARYHFTAIKCYGLTGKEDVDRSWTNAAVTAFTLLAADRTLLSLSLSVSVSLSFSLALSNRIQPLGPKLQTASES